MGAPLHNSFSRISISSMIQRQTFRKKTIPVVTSKIKKPLKLFIYLFFFIFKKKIFFLCSKHLIYNFSIKYSLLCPLPKGIKNTFLKLESLNALRVNISFLFNCKHLYYTFNAYYQPILIFFFS